MKYCSYNEPLVTVLRCGYLPNLTFPIADLTTHRQRDDDVTKTAELKQIIMIQYCLRTCSEHKTQGKM